MHTFRMESRFSTWLYSIVYNAAISRIRKKQPDTRTIEHEDYDPALASGISDQVDALTAEERKHYIKEALNRLHEEDAAILVLFYMDDQSVEEITQVTGLTATNVKTKLHRGRKKLFEQLQHLLKTEVKSLL